MATDFELMENEAKVLNTVTPDLRPFFKRGGKLLMYHGWNDRQVPAMSSVTYFERVLATAGRDAAGKSIQRYMIPGMDHCQGRCRDRHLQQGGRNRRLGVEGHCAGADYRVACNGRKGRPHGLCVRIHRLRATRARATSRTRRTLRARRSDSTCPALAGR